MQNYDQNRGVGQKRIHACVVVRPEKFCGHNVGLQPGNNGKYFKYFGPGDQVLFVRLLPR